MNRKYSVIVFDLGNVLVPFDYNLMLNRLDLLKKGSGKRFLEFYSNNYHYHRNFERGDLEQEKFLQVMLESCDNLLDKDTFCKYYSEIFREDTDVSSLLPLLKQKYRLVLLSNTNPIHRKYGYEHYEFLKYFDKLILSYEVGALKPEEAIYVAVEEFSGAPSDEHIFIDDIAEYAEGARKKGWDAIQYHSFQQLKSELQARNII